MGAYEDASWGWLRALTRQRRAEALSRPAVVRFSTHEGDEFSGHPVVLVWLAKAPRRRTAYRLWKAREWKSGNRACAYCRRKLTLQPCYPHSATVDHRHPLALGGDDAAWNWALACLRCNGAKAALTEAEFRALLAA